uniref:hypothetical protein n=1 Tax=Serratia sp. ASV30 TaxID=2795127 RepID=UPI0018ED1DCC
MEHFGGNAEAVRKKLHILSHENRSLLDELNGKHAEISLKIINEVDGNVFVEYNKTVNSLILSGEKINQITTDFTSTQEIEIISSILSRKHQLDLEVKHYDTLIESLQQRLARVGEIGDLLLKKSKLELEVKRVGKGLEDSQKYQELIQLHQKKIGEQDVILVRLNELNQLKSELPQYIECYTALEKDLVEYNNIHLTKIEIESKFEIENINLKDIDSVIRNWQEKLQIIKELQVNASNIYVEIASARKLISSLDSDIEVLDSNRNATLATNKAKLLELTHINSLDISIDSLLSSDVSSLDISDSIIFELSELRTKLTYYEGQLYGLLNVQKALTEQSSTIERLVGLGLEHISLHPTKICPLCVHEHLDDLALKNAIIGNKLASDALQSNSQMIEISIRLKAVSYTHLTLPTMPT